MKGFGVGCEVVGYETVTHCVPAGQCAGLVNLGNTCFLNAILQVSFDVYLEGFFLTEVGCLQALSSLPEVRQWLDSAARQCTGRLTTAMAHVATGESMQFR